MEIKTMAMAVDAYKRLKKYADDKGLKLNALLTKIVNEYLASKDQ